MRKQDGLMSHVARVFVPQREAEKDSTWAARAAMLLTSGSGLLVMVVFVALDTRVCSCQSGQSSLRVFSLLNWPLFGVCLFSDLRQAGTYLSLLGQCAFCHRPASCLTVRVMMAMIPLAMQAIFRFLEKSLVGP